MRWLQRLNFEPMTSAPSLPHSSPWWRVSRQTVCSVYSIPPPLHSPQSLHRPPATRPATPPTEEDPRSTY
uniref:Uncharacterized protein n=1 Tax=Chromera velia CCMP2878 TaxID=1169474 RepID=A0A0G4HL01_9ALVE|eukprot:Cvel_28587.t1-p1 / transcript=Cvel_28587.t1 / gene=Cvel_28587 / organism=Chromera_velia_CCMP2878 / gene_product=hypothetical protein / transcript_product=hypothetical protein / location=Cvel_scaffold3769:9181-9687(-) / protein_length=69 / sequence_SO=supercontig / SO=protein_coding / is_pseudo=false